MSFLFLGNGMVFGILNPTNMKPNLFINLFSIVFHFCQTPVLGLGLGVDFTFAGDNHNHKNHKNHNDKNDNNPRLNFVKGTVLGDKEQGGGIRDKG